MANVIHLFKKTHLSISIANCLIPTRMIRGDVCMKTKCISQHKSKRESLYREVAYEVVEKMP